MGALVYLCRAAKRTRTVDRVPAQMKDLAMQRGLGMSVTV